MNARNSFILALLAGPVSCSAQLSQERLVDLAEQHLRTRDFVLDRASVRIAGAWPADVVALRLQGRPGAPMPLQFELQRAGGERSLVTLAATLQHSVWTAVRPLAKGSRVDCDAVVPTLRRWVGGPVAAAASPARDTAGRCDGVARRSIGAGDTVRAGDIGTAPAVAAGAAVTLRVDSPGIRLALVGTAVDDADVGDVVGVRLQRPPRVLTARVVDTGTARLEEDGR
jgi:flagella basal body P-ring formation protein FlgA